MVFPLGSTTKDSIIRILSASWPLSAVKIWHALQKENYYVSYKAVYKSLQEMQTNKMVEKANNEYKLNEQWLKTTANTALEIIRSYKIKQGEEQTLVNITVYKFSDEFYRLLTLMLLNPGEIRLASKTPALFIKKESTESHLRQEYTRTLWDKIKEGKQIYYLFSTELAAQLIKEQKDKEAFAKIASLGAYHNLHLKHAPVYSVITMAVTKTTAIIGLASPSHTDLVGFIKIEGPNLAEIIELYDLVFANAKPASDFVREYSN